MTFRGDYNTDRGSMEQDFPVPRPYHPTPSQQMKAVEAKFAVAATSSDSPTQGECASSMPEGTNPVPKVVSPNLGYMPTIIVVVCLGILIVAFAYGYIH